MEFAGNFHFSPKASSCLVELSGHIKFRAFLIQPRLATREGFIIGHLRGGKFVPVEEAWKTYGIKVQACNPVLNNSITNSDFEEKFVIKATWMTERYVGPVQF